VYSSIIRMRALNHSAYSITHGTSSRLAFASLVASMWLSCTFSRRCIPRPNTLASLMLCPAPWIWHYVSTSTFVWLSTRMTSELRIEEEVSPTVLTDLRVQYHRCSLDIYVVLHFTIIPLLVQPDMCNMHIHYHVFLDG